MPGNDYTIDPSGRETTGVEVLLNIVIIVLAGAPVAVVTRNEYYAAAAGCAALLVVNVVYWRFLVGVELTEVYPLLERLTANR